MTTPAEFISNGGNGIPPVPVTYQSGHVKRNPETGEVAIRTGFDESISELANLAWLGATIGGGPRHHTTSEVTGWDDLYYPPLVVPPPIDNPVITNPVSPAEGSTA